MMIDKFENHDSNVFNEIMERPVDFFYSNMTCIITMSFDNLPERNSVDIEIWNKFLADSWNRYFSLLDNIFDFLKYCVYHTCLAGRFYKMNCSLSLDDTFYLIKDRLPNPDTSFKTWHQLHKLARLILVENCKVYSFDTSLILDLHTKTDGVCIDSQDNTNIINLVYLPDEEERVLVFHITVRYSNFVDKFSLKGSKNPSDIILDFNRNSMFDKPEFSKASKSATSPKQSDLFPKSQIDSNDCVHWEKYGARPKSKLYFQRNSSETTAKPKECEKIDSSIKFDEMNVRPRRTSFVRRNSVRSERIKKMLRADLEEACSNYQDSSLPSCSQNFTANGSHSKESDKIKNLIYEFQDSPPLPIAGMIKQNNSQFSDKVYFKLFNHTNSVPESLSIKRSLSPSSLIAQLSDDNSYYQEYGVKPKDEQCSEKCDPEVLGNKECKAPNYFEKDATEPAVHNLISPQSFPNTKGIREVFGTEEETQENPEDPREVQKKYEEAILNLMKSETTIELSNYDSTDNERLVQSLRQEQYTSVPQQDTSLKMPFICFAQYTAVDNKIFYTMKATEDEGLGARESMLRYYMETFFENYKILGASLRDNESSGTVMTFNPDNNTFLTAESESNRISFVNTKNSEEVNIEEAANQIRELSFDDENSSGFAFKTFDDKISFDWEHFSNVKSPSVDIERPIFLQDNSDVKDDINSENNDVLTVDAKQTPLEVTDETYETFFENFVKKLTESPSESPQHSENSQTLTYEKQISTPEKKSKYSDLLKLVQMEKSDDLVKPHNSPDDELLFDLCDESLELSNYSPESDSIEIEDSNGSVS